MRFKLVEDLEELSNEYDSEGNQLTEAQVKYFRNSRARDNQGRLLVCYHGSKADITTFDKQYIATWNSYGKGFYFTTDKNRAERYAKKSLLSAYINLVNPFIETEENVAMLIKEANIDIEELNAFIENEGLDGGKFFSVCYYLDDMGKDVSVYLHNLGFDGVIEKNFEDIEIVAFEPNQIKSTTNKTPSNSDNINERLLVEAKEDIQKFVDKFGEENYELFKNSNQRLKNAGLSTDILWYVKNIDKDELEDILSKLRRRLKVDINDYVGNQENNVAKQSSAGIRGEYKYLGEKDGYKVYQPLDYLSSMDLGYMTGWCTAGRFGHAGEKNFKPSSSAAKEHFNKYASQGVSLYYFLDSKTMEGLYAVALLPKARHINKVIGDYYIQQTNIDIYNQADEVDYSIAHELPLDLIPSKIVFDVTQEKDGLFIRGKSLLKVDPSLRKVTIPDSVTTIGDWAFYSCYGLTSVIIPSSVTSIGNSAFYACLGLTGITIPDSVTTIGDNNFTNCSSLTSIIIPSSVTTIGEYAFNYCRALTSVIIDGGVTGIGDYAFSVCSSLTSVVIPDSVRTIGEGAFSECKQLVIECHKGSSAEEYAKKNNIPVKYL